MTDKLTSLWSDDTLDQALGALHADVRTDETRLAQTRAVLLAEAANAATPPVASESTSTAHEAGAAYRTSMDNQSSAHQAEAAYQPDSVYRPRTGGQPSARHQSSAHEPDSVVQVPLGSASTEQPKPIGAADTVRVLRRRWRPLVAAAAVVGLVTTGFFVTTSTQGGSAEARDDLNAAANHVIISTNPVVPPGKYLHVVNRNWGEGRLDDGAEPQLRVLRESVSERWIPADRTQEWVLRRTETGRHQWVVGSDAEAKRRGFTFPRSSETVRAKCGAFYSEAGCSQTGSWQQPTPDWIASLPRDPEALFKRLKKDAPRNGRGDTELLVYAADALRSGLLPADLRSALYRALGSIDNLRISDRAANLDGRIGIAYGSDDGEFREELIIDPTTGAYLGTRTVDTEGEDKGHITGWSSSLGRVVATAPAR